MTHKIKSRLELETPPAPPGIKGVPVPQRGPSPFDNLDKEEWAQIKEELEEYPWQAQGEIEIVKEKHKYKQSDCRLTPVGRLIVGTASAFVISLLIMIGTLVWDSPSVVCWYLFIQACISLTFSGAFLLVGLLEEDYIPRFPYPAWVLALGFIFTLPVGLVFLAKKAFDVSYVKENTDDS